MMSRGKNFWRDARPLIWERAESLQAADFHSSHDENITPPTRRELREGGYLYRAKLDVLRDLRRQNP